VAFIVGILDQCDAMMSGPQSTSHNTGVRDYHLPADTRERGVGAYKDPSAVDLWERAGVSSWPR